MTRGLGLLIGTTHTVAATVPDEQVAGSVLMRRSTLTFGPDSTVRLGDPPDGATVLSEFAHRIGDVLVAGDGHHYTGQDLIAVAAHCLVAEANLPTDTPVVLTHPAVYSDGVVRTLRAALDRAGLARVGLVAAPVAALAWFEAEHTPLSAGLALVYELGPGSRDLTIVAFGAGGDADPIIGRPLRATEFDEHIDGAVQVPDCSPSPGDLTTDCLRSAGLDASALDVVLVTGAPPPPGLTGYFERMGMAVIVPPRPDTVVARGAALLAAASRPTTLVPVWEGPRRRTQVRHLRAVAAVVVAAAAISVPWFLRTTPAADDTLAAPFRPPIAHGVRLLKKAGPPHFPSASVTAAPEEPFLAPIDLPPADRVPPHVVAVTALPAPVDPVVEFPTELDTTVAPTTRKAPPAMVIPVTFTVPTTEPVPTQTTPPDTSVPPTEPAQPSTEPTATEVPTDTTPADPTTPSQSDSPVTTTQ
ncbi:MAG: hypothetical protein EOP32_17510 [Rhodococcus sp. (in: high G+C Gram-positive bacteria)]|nr:MAG: hypothetical protein EOP32_17510 [Rhodococcus sp. (in: high G+C Gram-positive bacteria)]